MATEGSRQKDQIAAIERVLRKSEGEEKIAQRAANILAEKQINFPKNLTWEEVSIKFFDNHEVSIKFRKEGRHADYTEMGFVDRRRKLPNKQWEFLYLLANNRGEISWKNSRASLKGKKQKQLLSEKLRKYFGINEDPFFSYKKERAYKIRIRLIPESGDNMRES